MPCFIAASYIHLLLLTSVAFFLLLVSHWKIAFVQFLNGNQCFFVQECSDSGVLGAMLLHPENETFFDDTIASVYDLLRWRQFFNKYLEKA
jgi:hypothetical protein